MKIEHIALWVEDLEKTKAFYQCYFNCVSSKKFYNPVKYFSSYFLIFKSGAKIEFLIKYEHRM